MVSGWMWLTGGISSWLFLTANGIKEDFIGFSRTSTEEYEGVNITLHKTKNMFLSVTVKKVITDIEKAEGFNDILLLTIFFLFFKIDK